MKIIERTYLERLIALKGTPDIKVVTGIRRCGKSKLMEGYVSFLQKTDLDSNIIYVDFTDIAYESILEYHALYEYVQQRYDSGKNNYVFIDEVQMCAKFELAVNSLHASGKYDIYITGSNAFLLSSDLATLFTGRYIEVHVFPFSFKEYCDYFSDETDVDKLFSEYVIKGGLAGSYPYKEERDRLQYIRGVYKTVITRDLTAKYKINDVTLPEHIAEYLMDNIGNLTSPNKISDTLVANDTETTHSTVGKYVGYLCNAFVFYDIKRYDIRGKKYLSTSDKYYLCDTGVRYSVLGSRNMDYGRLYENIVCIELLRRGYELYVGKLYENEVDFVAKRGTEQIYIQVADSIDDEKTFAREYTPLLQIKDAYPKLIIARTKHEDYYYDGIKIVDIARWLRN